MTKTLSILGLFVKCIAMAIVFIVSLPLYIIKNEKQ